MKKRFLAFIVLMAVLCAAFQVLAEDTTEKIYEGSCGKYLSWKSNAKTKILTISGTGNMPNYYSSIVAGSRAPWVTSTSIKNDLETVVISNGVESIGGNAFFECTNLKNVDISNSVKTIGNGAFYGCTGLTSIGVAKPNEEVADSVIIPDSVTSIGKYAFTHCTGLKKVTIPGNVKSIGDYAFHGCHVPASEPDDETESDSGNDLENKPEIIPESGLESVYIQEGVETIGIFAFSGCKKLSTIVLPDSITSIADNAFESTAYYNEWLNSKDPTWDVLYIGHHLIKASSNISYAYTVKPGTKTIADCAFYYCNLTSITIPDSVVSIGNQAFGNCNRLKSITIPKSVTRIGNEVFYICFDLQSINVDNANTAYCSKDGVLYNKSETEIIRFPKEKPETSFTIPTGVIKIADGAFEYCNKLMSITIPDSVISIGDDAFNTCNTLTNITIPNGVQSIGNSAFSECSKLTSITIPDGVQSIGEKTFYKCSKLKSITIPNSVLIIGEKAFEGCPQKINVNYIGSADDWDAVIGDGKYFLTYYAVINRISGISTKHSDNGEIVVKPCNIAAGKTVILALYNDGKLVEMQKSSDYSETNREITFTPTKPYTRAKAMVWNSLDGMMPVCGFVIAK